MSNFSHFLTGQFLLRGAVVTLEVSFGAFVVAMVVGSFFSGIQLKRIPLLSAIVRLYTVLTRGTPVLLQLLFVYDVLPSYGIRISAVQTAILVLGLSTATFFSEIMRGAVLAIDPGQRLAAESLGMSPLAVTARIIAPQAVRIGLPSLANQAVVLILTSSLASVISVPELTLRSQELVSSTFLVIAVYTASGVMYLVLTTAVAAIQVALESWLSLERPRQSWRRRWWATAKSLTLGAVQGRRVEEAATPVALPASDRRVAAGVGAGTVTLSGVGAGEPDEIEFVDERIHLDGIITKGSGLASDFAAPDLTPALSVRNLTKSYHGTTVVHDLSLDVTRGEVVVIMGPSGCGKSTLLRCLARLEPIDSGHIEIEGAPFGLAPGGKALRGRRLAQARAGARIGFVFQHFELFSHLTALQNVTAAPRWVYREQRSEAESTGRALLDAVGLSEHGKHHGFELSGGQKQRTAIARALAISPRIMLLDEPTSALDPLMVHEVLVVLRRLTSLGMTMIIVTHEVHFAQDVADSMVFMQHGRIVEAGPASEILERPKLDATRNFLRILEH